jgi:hypothetical protein
MGEEVMAFIQVSKTTPEHGLRQYYIDVDQVSMVNTGMMGIYEDGPEQGQPTGVRADESVIWLKGSQVYIGTDQTVDEVMALLLAASPDPEVFTLDDLRKATL